MGVHRRQTYVIGILLLAFCALLGPLSSCYRKALYRRFPTGDTGLFVGSTTTGSLVRSAVIALLHGALARMLLGLMMADHAAGAGPQKAMMTGIMPGDPADQRTFQTAGSRRRGRTRRDRSYSQGYCHRDQERSHS